MSEIRSVTTKIVHRSRPKIAVAEVETADGRHVEGVGASNLTSSRAKSIATERAKAQLRATDLGYRITYTRGWLLAEAYINGNQVEYGGSWMDGASSVALRGNQVTIEADDGETMVDVTGKSFLSMGRALESAVAKAERKTADFSA